ncbi:MAG: hypothetical protein WC712_00305 [Candidatus Brocadiia bacterium]
MRFLGIYFAALGLIYFVILVWQNALIIRSQERVITQLKTSAAELQKEQSELEFIRNAVINREPYFYINSLREDWGFRKKGEVLLSELPASHYVGKGEPVSAVRAQKRTGTRSSGSVLFLLFAGLAVAAMTYIMVFSPRRAVKKPKPSALIDGFWKGPPPSERMLRPFSEREIGPDQGPR